MAPPSKENDPRVSIIGLIEYNSFMEKEINFNVRGDTLRGIEYIPEGEGLFPGVILLHGSGSTGETDFDTAAEIAKNGIIGFAFNFRGCGISDGNFEDQTIGGGLDDARHAIEVFSKEKKLDRNRTGISGGSFGAFIASTLAPSYNFKSMVLRVPAAYSPNLLDYKHVDFKRELQQDHRKSISYERIGQFKGSLLVIRAELDEIIPKRMVDKYYNDAVEANRREMFLLEGAPHSISTKPEAKQVLIDKLVSWFKETL